MIYLIVYVIVGLLLYNIKDKKDKSFFVITRLFAAILLLSVLAALRDSTIGTDVKTYVVGRYKTALFVHDFVQAKKYIFDNPANIETGYMFLALFSTKIFGSINGILFSTAFIINTGVIIGLYRVREEISFNIAVLIFCFLFYQGSYNAMRQWLAIAIIIFGIKYLYEKNALKFGLTIAVAMLFHRTAIIAVTLYVLRLILPKQSGILKQTVIILATVLFVLLYQKIFNLAITSGIVSNKYMRYVEGEEVGVSFVHTIIRIPPIALSLALYDQMKQENEYHVYWFIVLLIDLILAQLGSITTYASRIAEYFTIARIFELSIACKIGNVKERGIVKILVISYVVLFWYVNYIYLGNSATYPYTSQILGI